MKLKLLLLFILLFPFIQCVEPQLDSASIQHYIEKNLPLSGTLKQTENGFVYLDISDRYIQECCHFIKKEGFTPPPYLGKGLVGAHVTVMHPKESDHLNIQELGDLFYFSIDHFDIVSPPSWEGGQAYLLIISAPELTILRNKYGLTDPLYPFHITLGVRGNSRSSF